MKSTALKRYVLLVVSVCFALEAASETRIFDKKDIEDQEPSGAVWHSRLNELFVVSDSGLVWSMQPDGRKFTAWRVEGNLEGIAIADPDSDFIYLGTEDPDTIKEFDLRNGKVSRTFDLKGTLKPEDPNKGLEALTFVPSKTPQGGLFYVGLQEDGALYVFELPINTSDTSDLPRHVETIEPDGGLDEMSGLHYQKDEDVLYAIYDKHDCLRAMQTDGTLIAEWELPKDHQEGITIVNNDLFVAQDNGKVWRYDLEKIKRRGKKCN